MESKRQQKFAGVIQKDLAEIFQREGMSFFNSTDNSLALNTIKSHSNEIRYKLGNRIKDQVRIVPHLEFFLDDTSEYVERMDKIFDKISKEPRQPEEPTQDE